MTEGETNNFVLLTTVMEGRPTANYVLQSFGNNQYHPQEKILSYLTKLHKIIYLKVVNKEIVSIIY